MNTKTRIIVAMSGGVDSSVAALLLMRQGYYVEGMFMKNWEEDDSEGFCSAAEDAAYAKAVCDKLGIPLHTVNFAKAYWDNVFEDFLKEYRAGNTPNPDILCNKEIKFKAFLDYAMELGADYMATGHYVRRGEDNDRYQLLKGLDDNKDQSYFLYTIGQQQLSKSLFPIGELEKPGVRAIAEQAGFVNHNKKDSVGICFIGERNFKEFLSTYIAPNPGDIETPEGKVIGKHDGLMYYTMGQRQGLGIGGVKDANEDPWYVLDKDLENNKLIVGQGHNHPLLFASQLTCQQIHWVNGNPASLPLQCKAKIRYRQLEQPCSIEQIDAQTLSVSFEVPQRAITPGQSVVFYSGEESLGGAIIKGVEK